MKRQGLSPNWAVRLALLSPLAAARVYGVAVGDVHAQVETGQRVFATSCANCHGAGGKGAIGPALVDRNLSPELVRTTVINGRVGTPMPPFKDELDPQSQAAVIAYVVSLTSGGHLPTEPIPVEAASASSTISTQPVAVGREQGIPAHGAALFFDATQLYACRSCHSFSDKGGPIGPDLAKSPKSAEQVYEQLSHANLPSINYPVLRLRLHDGNAWEGVMVKETSAAFVLFDVSALPPVKRTVSKSDVQQAATLSTGLYDHTKLPYSRQDRLDVSAYVGISALP